MRAARPRVVRAPSELPQCVRPLFALCGVDLVTVDRHVQIVRVLKAACTRHRSSPRCTVRGHAVLVLAPTQRVLAMSVTSAAFCSWRIRRTFNRYKRCSQRRGSGRGYRWLQTPICIGQSAAHPRSPGGATKSWSMKRNIKLSDV